jgi:carboxylate-amine ligase
MRAEPPLIPTRLQHWISASRTAMERYMGPQEPTFTFGIEEEYHLVDLKTRAPAAAPAPLMEACEAALGKQVAPEFFRSQIEIGTSVWRDFAKARNELAHLRRTIADTARAFGLAPIAASTHPFADKSQLETTPKERYQALARDFAGIGRRLAISGMHVHVGIENFTDPKSIPLTKCFCINGYIHIIGIVVTIIVAI